MSTAEPLLHDLVGSSPALLILFVASFVILRSFGTSKSPHSTSRPTRISIVVLQSFISAALALGIWIPSIWACENPARNPVLAIMRLVPPTLVIVLLTLGIKFAARLTGSRFVRRCSAVFMFFAICLWLVLFTTATFVFIFPTILDFLDDPPFKVLITIVVYMTSFGYWWVFKYPGTTFFQWIEDLMEPPQQQTAAPTTKDESQ